jgi:hypothetical protein
VVKEGWREGDAEECFDGRVRLGVEGTLGMGRGGIIEWRKELVS